MKEIFLEKKYEDPTLLGQFLDNSFFDLLVDEDCDVYKPCKIGDPRDESNVLLKFRKNFFPKELYEPAYAGFKDGAIASHNRGVAAGLITDSVQKQKPDSRKGRGWITEYHMAILNHFMQPSVISLFGGEKEDLAYIREKYKDSKNKVSGARDPEAFGKRENSNNSSKGGIGDGLRGYIWLEEKIKANNFDFDKWADETEKKSKDDQISEARWVWDEFVSNTNYATPVFSGVAGAFDRYPRIPFCRTTSYSANSKEKYVKGIPFIERLSDGFREFLPERYNAQMAEVLKIDPEYRIGSSAYSTLTINKNFRTAIHTDSGDLETGFGNLTCLSEKSWQGGYLCFPEFRVAVNIRVGDLLLMDVHEFHGNTPISGVDGAPPDRVSLVAYFRENMLECGAKKYEDLREEFVNYRKNNTKHPEWREHWNGISPSMFESIEWRDYMVLRYGEEFARQYHPEFFQTNFDIFFDDETLYEQGV